MPSPADSDPATSTPLLPSSARPVSTTSRRQRVLTYLLVPGILALSLVLFLQPSSTSVSAPTLASSVRSEAPGEIFVEVPTGDCSSGLQCRARIILQPNTPSGVVLQVGYLIRSSRPGSPIRPVDEATRRRVSKVTRKQARAWASRLFQSVLADLPPLAHPNEVEGEMAAAIMETKDVAKTCSSTGLPECAPLVKIRTQVVPPQPSPCICPKILKPVCGRDGRTYDNECIARCRGVDVECDGQCPCKTCVCPPIFSPVCPEGGAGSDHECFAQCGYKEVNCKGKSCRCSGSFEPVCGTDGETYTNECFAICREAEVECEGECPCKTPPTCGCPDTFDPVCAADGQEYNNPCLAKCASVEVECYGGCPCPCSCYRNYAPVCGVDGKTYPNKCRAQCHGVDVNCDGRCPCYCPCPKIYLPVCGIDGRTYDNVCFANCGEMGVECLGECPCAKH